MVSSSGRHTVLVSDWSSDVCSSDLFDLQPGKYLVCEVLEASFTQSAPPGTDCSGISGVADGGFKLTVTSSGTFAGNRSEEHTTELQSLTKLVCRHPLENQTDGTGLSGWTIKVYTDAATPVFVTS